MEYIKLILGIGLIVVFTWILFKNIKRSNLLHSILRIDTIIGIGAGVILVVGFIISLFA